jgi:hypothetical protein
MKANKLSRKERNMGLTAGLSIVVMAIAAGFAYGYVYSGLLEYSPGDLVAFLRDNNPLYMAGLAGWGVIFVTDVVVSLSLFSFYKTTNPLISKLAAFLRLVYTAILGVAIFQLVAVLPLLHQDNTAAEISQNLVRFEKIWSAGLVVFGLHLAGLGYLSLKSVNIPSILGYFLYIAGIAYTVIHGMKQTSVFSDELTGRLELILSVPMALGEILLALWLIYIGLRKK